MKPKKNPAAVALGRLGGSVKSAAKTATAQINGAKGGRPRLPAKLVKRPHSRVVLD